jgi:hypothetical protein
MNQPAAHDHEKTPKALIALVGLLVLRQVGWALWGEINVDEYENLQVLWLWQQGIFPFRDYLHSHLPVFSFLLWPFLSATGPSSVLPALVRLAFFPVQLLVLWQLFVLGRRVTGRAIAGWLTVAFFLASPIIGESLSEVRGDTLVYPMVLGAVLCLWRLIDSGGKLRWFYLAGLLLGVSLVFSQKPVLLALVIGLGFERHLARGLGVPLGRRVMHWISFTALVVGPYAVVLAWMAGLDIAGLENLVALPDNGVRFAQSRMLNIYRMLLLPTVLIPAGVIIGPALAAAWRLVRGRSSPSSGPQALGQVFAIYALVATVQLLLMPVVFMHLFVLPFMFFSLLAAQVFVRKSRRAILIAVVATMLLTHVHMWNGEIYHSRAKQTAQLDYLLEHVPHDRPVLDSLLGVAAFWPPVGRHLHYRPGFFSPEFYAEENVAVARALSRREFGAVVDQYMFRHDFPDPIRQAIDYWYTRAPKAPDILLPRD